MRAAPVQGNQLLVLDTVDDRRELVTLLDHLPPRERVAFLHWACEQVKPTERGHLPAPVPGGYDEVTLAAYRCDRASDRLTRMVYSDVLVILHQWGIDALRLAAELERRVRTRR